MDQRRKAQPGTRRGGLATAHRALASDTALGARAAAALAGPTAVGAVGGAGLALLAGRPGNLVPGLLAGGLIGAALGVGLGAWAIADRRGTNRARPAARRARRRAIVALALMSLGIVLAALALAPHRALLAAVLGLLLATLACGAGAWAMVWSERRVIRGAAGRRRDWHAQIRASRLTRRMLGMEAYRRLRREGALPVESTVYPNRTYLVPLRTTPSGARILVLQGGKPIGGLCLRPREPLPDPEEALAQILAIRADERAWIARANFFPQDRHLTPQARGLAPGRPGNYDR